MTAADLRLLPAATCIWALAVLGVTAGTAAAIAGGALLIAAVLTALLLVDRLRTRHGLLAHLAIVVLAGALLLPALERHGGTDQRLQEAAEDGLIVELSLIAGEDPAPPEAGPVWARSGMQAMARTVAGPARLGRERVELPASLPVLVRAEGDHADVLAQTRDGETIHVRGAPRSSGGLIVLEATAISRAEVSPGADRLQAARRALRDRARQDTAHLPADEAALVRGMTTGDTAGLGAGTEEMMRRAGISHLIAVSGANIALVLATVLGPLLLAGVRRRPRLVVAGAVMAGYVWLVGDEPSVQRAATMAAPLLAARFAGVRASPVAALALTVALWSVLDPVTAASVGFLLSALATAAILLAAPPVAGVLVELGRGRLGRTATLVIAVPLVAQLACTPLLILLTPEVSAWAVPVNLLVAPLVGPITVIGLLALVIGPVWPAAAQLLDTAAAGGAHLVLLVARTADSLPGSRIPVPEGATGALLAIAALLGLTLAIAARRVPLVRWGTAAVLVAALAPGIARVLPSGDVPDWTLAVCAVGQGDAVLLRASGDPQHAPTVLIDTGPDPAALDRCLDRLHVASIDLLVLTHPHLDHTGGRMTLTGNRTPAAQWICPLPEAADEAVPGVPTTVATTGRSWHEEGIALTVLWPGSAADAVSATAREEGAGEGDAANDCSVTLAATWADGTRLIALGDLEPAAQAEVLAAGPGAADIVKVAHHGSRRQDEELYRRVEPELALITVGQGNTFGHPTEETLGLLAGLGTPVIRTDVHGTVVLQAADPATARSVGPAR